MSEPAEVLPLTERPHVLYRMYDAARRLLYVGITFDPQVRWQAHSGDKPWWSDVASVDVEHFTSRPAVERAERSAVKAERPLYNVVHQRSAPRPPGSRRATPIRTAQIEDEIWLPARRIAELRGDSLSKVMKAAVERYVARHRHLLAEIEDE